MIGFAIPVDSVMTIAADLLSTRRLKQSWHGVTVKAQEGGLLVTHVDDESPAATVGLQSGDVIKTVGDQTMARPIDLERALLERSIGEEGCRSQ